MKWLAPLFMKKIRLLFFICIVFQTSVLGQVFNPWGPPPDQRNVKGSFIRKLFSHVSAEVGIGYGNTRYFQNLDDYGLYSGNNQLLLLANDSANNTLGISNWLNKPFVVDTVNFANAIIFDQNGNNEYDPNGTYLIDQGKRRLRGGGHIIPVHLRATINYWRVRAGGGIAFELNTRANMRLSGFPDFINEYQSDFRTFFTTKYYFTAGFRYFDFWDFSYYADVEYGNFRLSKNTFPAGNVALSKYWNISLPVEKNLSEYFSLVIRPSLDLKSIETALPDQSTIKTKMWNIQVQAGIRISLPALPKCPIPNCEVQKDHVHIDKKFRGQPVYKVQNPKVGENHRKMDRGKRGFFSFLKRQ